MREKLWKKYHEAKENKKGFTLVELIVVLVIIGILAAILLPSLLRYIDSAKDKQILANARTVYNAVTSGASEEYGKQKPNIAANAKELLNRLLEGENFNKNEKVKWYAIVNEKYQVTEVLYQDETANRQASLKIADDAATSAGDWVTGPVGTELSEPKKGWLIKKEGKEITVDAAETTP